MMLDAVIVTDNLLFLKEIINITTDEKINIKITYTATNIDEFINILKRKSFEIIFLNMKSNEETKEILNYINTFNTIKKPKIMLMIKDIDNLGEYIKMDNICNIMFTTDNKKEIKQKIIKTLNTEENANVSNIKSKVISEIFDMGYNIKLTGTKYLIESIMFIYENNNYDYLDNLEKNVYKPIADKHSKTTLNIKTNIAKSTRAMYGDDTRLTPKYVISDILTRLY